MDEKPYPFSLTRTDFRYEFLSISSKKQVKKIVILSQTETPNVYNLALLDVLEDGNLSDISETNNEDLKTVLATIIQIIDDFLSKNSEKYVLFRGSDERRQRLYRIVISRELEKIQQKFHVFGVIDSISYPFIPNEEYDFYLIKKK